MNVLQPNQPLHPDGSAPLSAGVRAMEELMHEMSRLEAAADAKDVDALRTAVWALEQYPASVPVLSRLLLEDWHDLHEDIVFELGLIGDSRAVEAIGEAVTIPSRTW